MIKKVVFSNFYSFKGKQEISFVANKKKSYDYFKSQSGHQITKVAGFIGGNASGKTNIMRLFSFIRYFVCESSKEETESGADIAVKTFFNNQKSSNFYIEFEVNNSTFFYEFKIQDNAIIDEILSVKQLKKGSRKVRIFSRNSNNINLINKKYFKGLSATATNNIRSDISLIAFLKSNYDIDIINDIFDYFIGMRTNINERGEINNTGHRFKTLQLYLQDNDIKNKMEDFICKFDVGLQSFDITRENKGNNIEITVQGIHNTKEKNNQLDFSYESRGTQSLLYTLGNILSALKNNKVVIIDEIESGLHSEALIKLIRYFIDENHKGVSQLLFSSHSLGFMNIMDMHQINLVEKDKNGESVSYPLNKVENIRSDENFLARYMTGSYGAFPKIQT